MKTFAAINVGSYEQTLKIYTITKNSGIREVTGFGTVWILAVLLRPES